MDNARFYVRTTVLTDGSKVYDVMVVDGYGEPHLFWPANTEAAALLCADALNLASGNWL